MKEVSGIQIHIQSDKKDILKFLDELKSILCDVRFNINKDLILIKSRKSASKEQYSTPYTLLDLEYDAFDVVERLKELTIKEYSETLFDQDDDKPPLLFVFGKDIDGKQIYIKLNLNYSQLCRESG